MVDELGPAVAILRDRAHRLELDWGIGSVQSFDQGAPTNIEPQVFWLVHDP
jgi:hypothetical protein